MNTARHSIAGHIVSLTLFLAVGAQCTTPGNSGGGGKGGSNASGEGGGAGDVAGVGGSVDGGKGGNEAEGGNVGGEATTGGKGGSTGGKGGTAMTGGVAGTNAGGSAGTLPMVSGDKPKWCTDPAWRIGTKSGELTGTEIGKSGEPKEPAISVQLTKKGTVSTSDQGWSKIYMPAQYESAKAGEVAVLLVFFPLSLDYVTRHLDGLIQRGEIPPTIAITPDVSADQHSFIKVVLASLQKAYPKISTDPRMKVAMGPSTGGAQAFDLAWKNSGLVANVIVMSGSFVCFRPNYPYPNTIKMTPSNPVRVTLSIGDCDIHGTDALWPAMCGANCGSPNCIDASDCKGDWLTENQKVAASLKENKIAYQYIFVEGGKHALPTWLQHMGDQLRWVFRPILCRE
jgi:hypothetical protein